MSIFRFNISKPASFAIAGILSGKIPFRSSFPSENLRDISQKVIKLTYFVDWVSRRIFFAFLDKFWGENRLHKRVWVSTK